MGHCADADEGYDADEEADADASQSSVQCSVSDHKLHNRVQEVATISDSDTEVEEVIVTDTAFVVTWAELALSIHIGVGVRRSRIPACKSIL